MKRESIPVAALIRIALILAIAALGVGLSIALAHLLDALDGTLFIFAGAIFLAYALTPLVSRLRRSMPQWAAVSIAYLLLLSVVAFFFAIVVPPAVAEMRQFLGSVPAIAAAVQRKIMSGSLFTHLPPEMQDWLAVVPDRLAKLLETYGVPLAQHGINVILSAASVTLSAIIIPILAAYLLFDASGLRRAALGVVPERHRAKALAIAADLNEVLGCFIRGQILDGIIVGTLIGTMLALNHVPYALLIGTISAFLNLVPYLSILTVIPSVLLALAYNGWQNALFVAALFGIIQQLDCNFIEPYVMRVNVSLAPTIIISAIVGLTALFGPFGTFIAVPLAAMLRVVKLHFAPAPPTEECDELEARASALRRFSS